MILNRIKKHTWLNKSSELKVIGYLNENADFKLSSQVSAIL